MGKYGYNAMRILRADLLQAMLETLNEAGVEVQYGKNLVTGQNIAINSCY